MSEHLAGSLGVRLHDGLLAGGALAVGVDGHLRLTADDEQPLVGLGVSPSAARPVRGRLDWSERRPHLAGGVADARLTHFLADGWLRRHPTRPRARQLGADGRRLFSTVLSIEVP